MAADQSPAGPPRESLSEVFHVRSVRGEDDRVLYFGQPLVGRDELLEEVWPLFREEGYEVRLTTADRVDVDSARELRDPFESGTSGESVAMGGLTVGSGRPPTRQEYVLVAESVDVGIDAIPWKNVVLFLATVLSTMYAGSMWYHVDLAANPVGILRAWPFAAAIMGVLAVHEFGHYVMTRYHGVQASLPYFIPLPLTIIGTMGAVIRMRGRMPDRKALFDIGVAGPLAGLVATAIVTAIGLFLSPVEVPQAVVQSSDTVQIRLGFPPLMYLIAWATGQSLSYGQGLAIHPVVIGGWVGMFVTFLNMIPVGQLDGGHVVRALAGDRQELIAAGVPAVLFGLAGYLYFVEDVSLAATAVWGFWGVFSAGLAFVGPAQPVDDGSLGVGRVAVGLLALVLGLLCFTPVPVEIVG